ncbi:MAG: hypothetical protein JSW11_03390 [Candidatus Heimdallarchaeota archaeon]|nr:MAG: hypothetical protein JSW11_03390 [Candidatus Heimdallarchaeota archaeon]
METFDRRGDIPIHFFLALIVFDEEHGPVLNSYLTHGLKIPKIILQGVTTTLFTMAIGVGEPTGEPETAIIPINVTGIQGRILIHSFVIDDPEARGRNRIESFMLFIPRAHQDKLLQHSLAFSNILQEAIHEKKYFINNSKQEIYSLDNVFENIKKILLTKIDNTLQDRISDICTDKETVLVSDGTIRAVHNIILSPDIISLVNKIPSLIQDYEDELKTFGTFFDALPIEIHGKTYSNHQFYMVYIRNNFIIAFSSGKGRLGSLFRNFREILWNLSLQSNLSSQSSISRYSTTIKNESELFPQNQFLDKSFQLLKSFQPIITDVSLSRCNMNVVETLRTSSNRIVKKHALICQIFEAINNICSRLFRTDLVQVVLSQHGTNAIALKWATNSEDDTSLFMVGDSTKGVGLLKLVGEQVLEYRGKPDSYTNITPDL